MISVCYGRETCCPSVKQRTTVCHRDVDVKQTSRYLNRLSLNRLLEIPFYHELPHPMRFLNFAAGKGCPFFQHMALVFVRWGSID